MKKIFSILLAVFLLSWSVSAFAYRPQRTLNTAAMPETTFPDDISLIFGTSSDFCLEYDSSNGYLQLGDCTNDFLRVTDAGTTGTFAFLGDGSFSGNLYAATYGSDSSITDAELKTIDDGAVTEILVGGGAGSAPVWGTDIPTAVTIGAAYIYRAGGTDVADADVVDTLTITNISQVGDITASAAAINGIDDCALTEIMVGGGAGSAPICTTATGTDAPVRATSPTLVTPVLGVASATSLSTTPTSAPSISGTDSDQTDPDVTWRIYGNASATGTGAEVADLYFQAMGALGTAGTLQTAFWWDGSAESLILPQSNDPVTPTLAIGSVDMGLYASSSSTFNVAVDGGYIVGFTASGMTGNVTGEPYTLYAEIASATNPVYSFSGDLNSGLGHAATDAPSMVAGGVEAQRWTEASRTIETNASVCQDNSGVELKTVAAHGLAIDDVVQVAVGTGVLCGGLSAATNYYVLAVGSTTTATLSASRGGSIVAYSTTGTAFTSYNLEITVNIYGDMDVTNALSVDGVANLDGGISVPDGKGMLIGEEATSYQGATSGFRVATNVDARRVAAFTHYQADDTMGFILALAKSQSDTQGTLAYPGADSVLGDLVFAGADEDGARFEPGAKIRGVATELWDATGSGTKIEFYTTDDGTLTNDLRMTIDQDGDMTIGESIDEVTPTFSILGDADSDAEDVSETLSLTLIPNATPTSAVWQFDNTQALGYNFANGNVGIGTTSPDAKLDVVTDFQMSSADDAHGGYITKIYSASTGTLPAATTDTIQLNIPTGWVIQGCQLHVKTALAGGDTWDAELNDGGTEEAIASNQAVAQNTNVNHHASADAGYGGTLTDAETDILITKNGGGSFTAQGEIEATCIAKGFDTWDAE